MNIKKQTGVYNLSRRSQSITHIVIHYSGTNAGGYNNCLYFGRADRQASADYFVDKNGTIWQYNPDINSFYSWHSGDKPMNKKSVGIEFISAGEDFTASQIKAGGELVRWLCSTYGIGEANIIRHYDVIGKHCPAPYINAGKWATLKSQLLKGSAPAEATPARSGSGWAGVKTISESKGDKMYRLYNAKSGEHFFTSNKVEYDTLKRQGWRDEGVAWKCATGQVPLYRLNSASEHFYTINVAEVNNCLKNGWVLEGIASMQPTSGAPVYRLINSSNGTHFFTSSTAERDNCLKNGWKSEGIAFYAVK